MTTTNKNLLVFALGFVAIALPSILYLQQNAYGEDEFNLVLRVSARLAILVYLVIFVARPLRQLTNSEIVRPLLRYRRQIGVGFAAIMSAHLVFIVWLNGFVIALPGMIAYTFISLMFITSFDGPTRALGPKRWRLLHKAGLYYIGLIFSATIVTGLFTAPLQPFYAIAAALFVVAIAVRVLAWRKHHVRSADQS